LKSYKVEYASYRGDPNGPLKVNSQKTLLKLKKGLMDVEMNYLQIQKSKDNNKNMATMIHFEAKPYEDI